MTILPRHQPPPSSQILAIGESRSLWQDAWDRLRKNHLALAGLGLFVGITLFCFVGPFLTPFSGEQQNLSLGSTAPLARIVEIRNPERPTATPVFTTLDQIPNLRTTLSPATLEDRVLELRRGLTVQIDDRLYTLTDRRHWLGTDKLGRDQLVRIMEGGRVSLGVGFLATAVSLVIGVLYGATSAYVGGKTDAVMMRIVDILYALPFTIFVILLMVLFGRSLLLLFIAIGAVEWLTMARIVRGQVLSLKKQEFVEAAVALGQKTHRIIGRHLIPNVLGPIIVYATLTVPAVMLLESVLSFLGLGVQPPNASWGVLIKEGAESMTVFPWLLLFPAAFFSFTLFSLNFLGDGLRDALDVRASKD